MFVQRPYQQLLYYGFDAQVYQPARTAVKWYLAGSISAASVLGVYLPYGAADSAEALYNIDNPGTNDLTGGINKPSWTADGGLSFDGVNDYLTVSNVLLASGYSVLMRIANAIPTDGRYLFGAKQLNKNFAIGSGVDNEIIAYSLQNYASSISTIYASTSGCTGLGITGTKAYRNGTQLTGTFLGFTGTQTISPFLGCFNNSGSPSSYADFDLLWMAIYNATITGDQVAAVYAAAPI